MKNVFFIKVRGGMKNDTEKLIPCPGCGARFPDRDGPTHRYLDASPGCWAAYGEVLAREYSDLAYMAVHHLTVDAYSVQHPGTPSRRRMQSVAVHLIGLYAGLELGLPRQRVAALMNGATEHLQLHWLDPPGDLGSVTVADVLPAQSAEEHGHLVQRWAESAWTAWSAHHAHVERWVRQIRGT